MLVGRRPPVANLGRCGERRGPPHPRPGRRRAGAGLPPAWGQRVASGGGVRARRRLRALRPGLARQLLPRDVAAHRDRRRVGGLPARAGASRARGRGGRVRRVVLDDRARRRPRHRPVAGADRRRQRGRQPGRRHVADVPRARRADARRAAADLSGHRAVLRHRELSQVLDRIRQHSRRDAVLLAAVPRRQDAVAGVSGGACAGRIARGPAARDRRDRGIRCAAERGCVVRAAAA